LRISIPSLAALLLAAQSAFAQDFSAVQVEAAPLRGSTHLLTGAGGNIVLSIGDDGAFLIDDQFAPLAGKIRARVEALGKGPVRFVMNTHWHGDHTGGNESFGGGGAVIVAHDNVRKRMSTEQFITALDTKVPPSPVAALPVVTFAEGVSLHFNGDTATAVHVAAAHTDGDALVKFAGANVLHMGDTFFNQAYPFIDTSSGGTIDGMIAAVDTGLGLCDAQTIVVPGHGPTTDRAGLQKYREMLAASRAAVAALKQAGKTEEEAIAAKPTAATDDVLGNGFIKPDGFVRFIYQTL
jgi:cyclase